jgi:hypothetical protein
MKNLFQTPSTIENISTRKDGTIKIVIGTQELPPDEMAQLMSLYNKLGYFLFKENDITPDEIPEDDAPEFEDEKSPTKRLYSVLYVFWKQQTDKGKMSKSFNDFRKEQMEKFIDVVKDKLD